VNRGAIGGFNRGAIGGMRPGIAAGRTYGAPAIAGARAFTAPGLARGYASGAGLRGGSIAASRGFAGTRGNVYGLGTRPFINSAARFGGLSNAGRLGINSRPGSALTATSLNRSLIANSSLAANRINTATALGYRGWTGLNSRTGLYGGYGGYGRGYGNWLGYGYGGYGGYGLGWRRPWYGYGYGSYWPSFGYGWGGYWPFGYGLGSLGYGLGWGLGTGLGWGLGCWPYGSSLYDWGYLGYYNPYVNYIPSVAVAQGPLVSNYAQPITTTAPPPATSVADQASALFDGARDAFKSGEYARALDLVDEAIREAPNETALHEFRALAFFALQRYDEAAAALHAVLAVGPGWDWATLIGLYPGVDVYTEQLRALEDFASRNPNSAPARLVLAYHYLTEGHNAAALEQFKRVVALQPKDTLTARLVQRLETIVDPAGANQARAQGQAPPPQPGAPAAIVAPGKEGRLEGNWTTKPDNDSTISVTFTGPGQFRWTITNQGKDRQIQGKMTYGNGILTLAQDQGPPMVGNITWLDETRFVFKVPGTGPDDPGLTFTKSP